MRGWQRVRLGDVATLQRGFDLPVQDRSAGNIPIFAANGRVGSHNVARVEGPGVVTGRSGSIGKVHYVAEDFWPLNTALYVRDFHGNDPQYVSWLLREMKLDRYSTGTGVPTLNRNVVHEATVLLPPLDEQRRIAAILDRADQLRALRRQTIVALEGLPQARFREMFGTDSGGHSASEVAPLQAWIDPARPITYGILKPGDHIDEGIPYVRVADMRDGGIRVDGVRKTTTNIAAAYRRSQLVAGDLLISIRGHVGRCAFVPPELDGGNITQDSARLAIANPESAVYVRGALETPSLQHWMARRTKGAAVRGINLGDLRLAPIPQPPLSSQVEYAESVREVLSLIAEARRELRHLDELFASVQSRAFSGQL